MVTLNWYLALSIVVFCIGLFGLLTRRNILIVFLSIEIMLNAINIALVSLSHYLQDVKGQILALFVIAIAGGAVAVGLIILILSYWNKPSLKLEDFNLLRED